MPKGEGSRVATRSSAGVDAYEIQGQLPPRELPGERMLCHYSKALATRYKASSHPGSCQVSAVLCHYNKALANSTPSQGGVDLDNTIIIPRESKYMGYLLIYEGGVCTKIPRSVGK